MLRPSAPDLQWGRRPDGGNPKPPDIEQLWRDVNRKVQCLFGRHGGGHGPEIAKTP